MEEVPLGVCQVGPADFFVGDRVRLVLGAPAYTASVCHSQIDWSILMRFCYSEVIVIEFRF